MEHDEIVIHQPMDEPAARLLHRDGHRTATKAFPRFAHPGTQCFRRLLQDTLLHLGLPGDLQTERLLAVGPIGETLVLSLMFVLLHLRFAPAIFLHLRSQKNKRLSTG